MSHQQELRIGNCRRPPAPSTPDSPDSTTHTAFTLRMATPAPVTPGLTDGDPPPPKPPLPSDSAITMNEGGTQCMALLSALCAGA